MTPLLTREDLDGTAWILHVERGIPLDDARKMAPTVQYRRSVDDVRRKAGRGARSPATGSLSSPALSRSAASLADPHAADPAKATAERLDTLDTLRRAVQLLSRAERVAFLGRYRGERSAVAAGRLGCSVATVDVHVCNARVKIRRTLYGIE